MPSSRPTTESVDASTIPPTGREYLNLAAYKFVRLDDLHELRRQLRRLTGDLELRGTILLSPEGINLFIAGENEQAEHFLRVLREDERFRDLVVKKSWTDYQPFRRMLVKLKREIIAFGIDSVRPEERTSPKLSPETLKAWLDEGKELVLLDTRNDYEVELGTFRDAIDLGIHHFRDFPKVATALPEELRDKPLVMFCTGGIRCEKAGPYLEQNGFRHVYQLDGGILNYFERCGGSHYEGDCFVFDHRVAVTSRLEPSGARLCFACQSALTAEEMASDRYQIGVSCPKCYTSEEEQKRRRLGRRQALIDALASDLPGSRPYENRRPMFVARQYAGASVIDWLSSMHAGHDRRFWQEAIDRKEMLTGAHYLTAETLVEAGTIVREGQVIVHCQKDYVEPRVNGQIELLYEDPWLVVVHKPAPLPCHASGRYQRNTLEYLLAQAYRPEKLHLAHRLDARTTGLVALSRRYAVASKLQRQFSEGTVEKVYLARVSGVPPTDRFECDAPIGRGTQAGGRRRIDPHGDSASTAFRVVHRYRDQTTLLEVIPRTGRTHQIRLHLAYLGYPIVGDHEYATPSDRDREDTASAPKRPDDESVLDGERLSLPLQLHAWKLKLVHPKSGEPMALEAAMPRWAEERDS